jgi:hypothetical protein
MPRVVQCTRRKSTKTCLKPNEKGIISCTWNSDLGTCSPLLSKKPVAAKSTQRVVKFNDTQQMCVTNARGNYRRGVKPQLVQFALRHVQDPKNVKKWTFKQLCDFVEQAQPIIGSQPVVKSKDVLATIQKVSMSKDLYDNWSVMDRVGYAAKIERVLTEAREQTTLKDCDIINKDLASPAPFWAQKRIGTSSSNGEAHLVIHKSSFSPPLMFVMRNNSLTKCQIANKKKC